MMNIFKIKLLVYTTTLIIFFIIQGCFLVNVRKRNSGVVIGGYWVPAISGWEKSVRKDGHFSNVRYTYSSREGIDTILKFVKFPSIPEDENTIRTREEFLNQVKKEFKRSKAIADPLGINMILISSSSREFLGLPAVEFEILLEESGSFSYKKVIRFIEDHNEYYLELTTTRKNKNYSHSKEGINAWNRILKELKRVSD